MTTNNSMPTQENPLAAATQSQVGKLAQLIDVLGWSVMDPTLPPDVSRYALARLSSLLDYLKAREQSE